MPCVYYIVYLLGFSFYHIHLSPFPHIFYPPFPFPSFIDRQSWCYYPLLFLSVTTFLISLPFFLSLYQPHTLDYISIIRSPCGDLLPWAIHHRFFSVLFSTTYSRFSSTHYYIMFCSDILP